MGGFDSAPSGGVEPGCVQDKTAIKQGERSDFWFNSFP